LKTESAASRTTSLQCCLKAPTIGPRRAPYAPPVLTTLTHSAGGQFVIHAAALPGNPYDGHSLDTVIPQMQALIRNILDR
jgi:transposase, IS5 family